MGSKLPTILMLAALLALSGVIDPGRAAAAEKAIFGPVDLVGGQSAFPVYEDLGVDTWQDTLNWRSVAPERPANPTDPNDPAYRWPPHFDRAIAEARATDIDVALLVLNSPAWANGGRDETWVPRASDFADFLTAASRRYGYVRRWMIWGEPNRADRFQPNEANSPVGPRAYAEILDAGYEALKRQSSKNIVIGGMTWTGGTVKPSPWMRRMRLPNGQPPRLDWFGHNPFPFRFPNLRELVLPGGFRDISDMDTFSRQLGKTYGPKARFWLSEYTVLSDQPSGAFELSVTRAEQARYVEASYKLADSLDTVAGLGWFSLVDERPDSTSNFWGLLTFDHLPKPSYAAYKRSPSERFRPAVRLARRPGKRTVRVTIRAKVGGRARVELRNRARGLVAVVRPQVAAGRPRSVRFVLPRKRRNSYLIRVMAPRAARADRPVR